METLFESIGANLAKAGEQIALMHREYPNIHTRLDGLHVNVRKIQGEFLDIQEALHESEEQLRLETVLLVEDEAWVRTRVSDVLRESCYQVLDAASGAEALLFCKIHRGPIHLIITDVVRPWMIVEDLVAQVSLLHPEMRALYMSGITRDALVRHGILDRGMPFLGKPFTPEALTRKVREVLESPQQRLESSAGDTRAEEVMMAA